MSIAPIVHVALLPSAGMGHLTPFLRLAALLVHHHCQVTLIIPHPTVSKAESELLSRFHSSFPQVNQVQFHLLPSDSSTSNTSTDPFFLRFAAIRSSCHLLSPLLASVSPPLSAFVYDMTLISPVLPIANTLGVPHYILFTSSATMFSFFSYFPTLAASASFPDVDVVEIPGVSAMPRSSIPPLLFIPYSIYCNLFMEDSPKLANLHGVLINTFEGLEAQSLEALNGGKVVKELPPVYAVGPFVPCEFEKEDQRGEPLKWLDDQPSGSVVYVSFGSRTAMGRDQIREIGYGLVRSGYRFLWVVKDKKLDKEEEEGLDGVLGAELEERIKEKGIVVKEWVDQREILGHKAVGGFVSHCGWNSLIEAAWHGVPIMGWPQIGDQKINAEAVSKRGWGMWKKDWGWEGERVVKGEEIGEAIKEIMNNESLMIKAAEVKEDAKLAISKGGGYEVAIQTLIEEWRKNVKNI
ncbi:UDP-glycosyltransferase 708G1-like [Gastrolobium bilobum]|uniref:UDP-glycosyltransferase 708G1-like n=1 Tax=Gastrolobium bilobum TaxID=150636 RepID=UPI002AB3066A|nr:UDP-glycosyltransferase 708G1-like [Gastrolobium bilobum]